MTCLDLQESIRTTLVQNSSSPFSSFRPHINNMIGNLDHIKVVLYHQNGIPPVHQFVQNCEQKIDILKMQSGGRLIQDIKSPAGILLGKFSSQLDTLCFATTEGDSGLSQCDVSQPYFLQYFHLAV